MDKTALLPNLASLYHRGLLVPFIGSGMSRPACTSWNTFLEKLARQAGMDTEADTLANNVLDTVTLYRIADSVVHNMHALSHEEKCQRYRQAIQGWITPTPPEIPANMKALTDGLFWPLVLTTNYDDLYWAACDERVAKGRHEKRRGKQPPLILGRGLPDCHQVLRSLDRISPPILWALQGFLGGQRTKPEEIFRSDTINLPSHIDYDEHRLRLETQVVAGHQQYQQAINGDPHFRRAFAEVFRRRSLLFIGSGILEDYLLNLFSEIIYNHGASAYPHIALLPAKEKKNGRFDERFLQTRLGIKPIFWENSEEIGDLLNELKEVCKPQNPDGTLRDRTLLQGWTYTLTLPAEKLEKDLTPKAIPVTLAFQKVPTDLPDKSCAVFSAGRNSNNTPRLGSSGRGYFGKIDPEPSDWKPLDSQEAAYIYQYDGKPIFTIAARHPQHGTNSDYRDLGIIPEAVKIGLQRIDKLGYEVVYMGAIAAGGASAGLWHPVHPFAQTLRGIRRFVQLGKAKHIRAIHVCIVDPSIWAMLASSKLPVDEILTAEFMPLSVELYRSDGHIENYNLLVKDGSTVEQVLQQCNIAPEKWRIVLTPRPTDSKAELDMPDRIVTATMTVLVSPKV
jgi:hypothetical protein